MAFLPVANVDEIPEDAGKRVRIEGIDVGLYRVGEKIYAMEDVCPHAGFPLSKGKLEGCVIVCEAHGWPFDIRTGFDPENEDGFPIPCFAVTVEDGIVHVDLEQRTNEPRRRPDAGRKAPTRPA